MPLNDSPFERGKCGLKAIQYMALGIPALVSPVGVNQEIVENGIHGFHCNQNEEWLENIRRLMVDDELRIRMGMCARERVMENYSIEAILPKILNVFENVSKRK